ncbi:MAG: hypothetical protein CL570_03895 [Alphaproteobacteria bacterium]|nr:hypothetical protein [Alphaproteobacteria bacterium]
MHRKISKACLLMASLFVSACSSMQGFNNDTPQLVAEPDSVSAMLADAADRVASSLEKLAAVEYQRSPGVAVAPVSDAPVELRRAITVNWVGPVEPIVETLANRSSYSFIVLGSPPPVPIVVSLDVENMPVVDVLRDIGLQMGVRADIRVDGRNKTVEIQYAPTTGVGVS